MKKTGLNELISFNVAGQHFCVDVMAVREIKGWMPATPLPHTPSYMRGVIDLRGAVLSIIDLAARLGFPPTDPSARHVIIVAEIRGEVVGLLVDSVSDILNIDPETIQPTPDFANELTRQFVSGLVATEGSMISVLSLERLLSDQERAAAA
jgi:purine-binding chemotaxis protein CheW